ncbi:MAG: hypothetical protein KH315_06450 [Faecalibacterium prausnitzii]|uniref:Uncharacterized protein n=1 Tax=Faecalibacterium prausnitzii TaxID=853 RepID=A0A9E1GK36_9FIRM|nr:hypothetical protein [Faecalibacterium prausnitzii]
MSIQELLTGGGGLVILALTVIQVAPVKINPWSAIAKAIGRAINAEVLAELERTRIKLDNHIKTDDERAADMHRARILRFNQELIRQIPHTREEFIEVLTEIDRYQRFCREHPDYPNSRAVHAIANIGRVYDERLQKHDFL